MCEVDLIAHEIGKWMVNLENIVFWNTTLILSENGAWEYAAKGLKLCGIRH